MICRKCNQDKPLEAMKRERRTPNQRPLCKECHNENYRAYSARNRDRVREQKIRYNATHRQELREKARKKASSEQVKAARAAKGAEYYKNNKDKSRAHYLVAKAIASGELTRPGQCERCGGVDDLAEGSHNDYSKPLEVEWLCPSCHRKKDNALSRVMEHQNGN